MTWDVAVAGTITLDEVTTPAGHRDGQQGGSAVYFALAAARHAPVIVTGVVGHDGESSVRRVLHHPGIRLDGVSAVATPTYRWAATHDYARWITSGETSSEGPYGSWRPQLPPAAARAPVLFAGSMRPDLQADVLRQSGARLVGLDTMRVFIASARDHVREVAAAADILFVDRAELSQLTGTPEDAWRDSARSLCGRGRLRAVVVKAGPLGAACVTASSCHQQAAAPVDRVIDPTGAGDALAGGFLGACARAERDDDGIWLGALEEGTRCAAQAISEFGTDGLRRPPG